MIWDKFTRKNVQENTTFEFVCLQCGTEYGPDKKSCPKDGAQIVTKQQVQKSKGILGSTFVDRYQIQSVLGEGGMSIVYKANHTMMDRIVAIKILKHFESSQDKMLKRFQQEARAASSLNHPNLITIHDFGITPEGQAYLVMDYLEGQSLDEMVQQDGYIKWNRIGNIFMQVCDGLDHAHGKGIVHRDIKPSNILVIPQGTQDYVKIVDFGIAKLLPEANKETFHLTQAGQLFGSPLYMSPEQCANRKVDSRTDIYALGATLHNVLSGRPPFQAATLAEVIYKHLKEDPQPVNDVNPEADIPQALQAVVLRCMQKDPADRFQSMMELKTELMVACDLQKRKTQAAPNLINVVIAEDNDELAATITETIAAVGGAFVSARAVNGEEAIDKVMQQRPQLVLLDVKLPVLSGVEVTKQLKSTSPNLRVCLFSVASAPNEIIEALNAGADGYILQDLSAGRLGPAIKAVVSGIPWIDPEITSRVLQASAHAAGKSKGPDTSTRATRNEQLDHSQFLDALASVYVQEKKYDEAEALFHGAIALEEKARGKDSAEIATLATKLADVYMARKKSGAAEQLYKRALQVKFQTLGPEHMEVAASLEALALLCKTSGSLIESELYYSQAVRIRLKIGAPDDEQVVTTMLKLASVQRALNREQDAAEMERRAHALAEERMSKTAAAIDASSLQF
jgi:serine/threonine protein kinase